MESLKLDFALDDWQKKFLGSKGDKVLCCGRQIGKSAICGIDAGEWAAHHANTTTLMIAPTERQAYALFMKTLDFLAKNYKDMIMKGRNKPTMSRISLKNGHVIHCLPTGLAGLGIRFLTVGRLYADEASRIPDDVWEAVTPMLLTTGGDSIYLSTPAGAEGYFADVVNNKDAAFDSFFRMEVSSEDIMRNRPICATWTQKQRDDGIMRLEREKKRMSARQYAQEYLGRILADLRQVFPDHLIRKCMRLERRKEIRKGRKYYLGVDIARMGEDESTFEIMDMTNREMMEHVEHQVTKKTLTTETARHIFAIDKVYDFRQIFVDDGGMGVGVFDQLLEADATRRKVVAINNTNRPQTLLTVEEKKKRRVLKEDIYNNLLSLMEQGKIALLKDEEIFESLKSVQFELVDNKARYFGNYMHITDGLVRAAWCVKDKSLNIYAY